LNDGSEPEPDIAIVVGEEDRYDFDHPQPADIVLLVEVSDTTLRFDRGKKRSAYARAGIVEYWILNILKRQIEVHRDPRGSRYRSVTILHEQDTVSPLGAPHATVRVADLLPRGA
jgi:Uma2 family endonuclease